MNYTILWTPTAEAQLVAILNQSGHVQRVLALARRADRTLRSKPERLGESRSDNFRLWFPRPLSLLFEIDEPNLSVYIAAVRWVGN